MVAAGTTLQSEGRWFDGQLIRFLGKDKMPVGGWRRLVDGAGESIIPVDPKSETEGGGGGNAGGGNDVGQGVVRGMIAWRTTGGVVKLAFGTVRPGGTQGLFVVRGSDLFDITPASGSGDEPVGGTVHTTEGSTASPPAEVPYGVVRLSALTSLLSVGAVAFSPVLASHATTQSVVLWVRLRDLPFYVDDEAGEVTLLYHADAGSPTRFLVWQVYLDELGTFGPPGETKHWLRVYGPGGGFDGMVFDMTGMVTADDTRRKISLVYDGGEAASDRFRAYLANEVAGVFEPDVEIPQRAVAPITGTIPASGGFSDVGKFGGYFATPLEDAAQLDINEVRLYAAALDLAAVQAEDVTLAPATAAVHRYSFTNSLADTGASPQAGVLEGNAELGTP